MIGRRSSRRPQLALAAVTALALVCIAPSVVFAECDGPVPSFPDFAPKARTVVIGDVTAIHPGGESLDGHTRTSSRFTLRVGYVLKGTAHRRDMEVRDVVYIACNGGKIVAAKGDRIILALGFTLSGGVKANTVAWIVGTPQPTAQRIRFDEAYALFGLDPGDDGVTAAPDTGTLPTTPHDGLPWLLLFGFEFLAAAGVLLVRPRAAGPSHWQVRDRSVIVGTNMVVATRGGTSGAEADPGPCQGTE